MSLTHVAEQTRAMIVVSIITLVVLVFGYWGYNYTKNVILPRFNPPEPPQPSYGFGLLPPIEFPEENAGDFTYKLETIGNEIPSLSGYFMPVYLITNERKSSGFFSLDRAKAQAASLGFILEPQLISGTEYRWVRNTPIYAQLDMDTVNNRFSMQVSWETDPSFLSQTSTPSQQGAISEIQSLLRSAGFLPEDLAAGRTEATLLQYEGGEFTEAVSLSETQFVQVDLFRRPITLNEKTYEVLPADPNTGLASGLVSSARAQGKRIVSLDYRYVTIDYENPETYPYISGREAWNLLLAGEGYVAVEPSVGTEAVVRRVEAAYYDPLDDEQRFLQPIYVFKGDNDFVAYVPAIHPTALQSSSTTIITE